VNHPDPDGFGFTEPTDYIAGPSGPLAVYERAGSGTPLLLIHGINMRAAVWAGVVDLLGDRHIIVPDLRGHGRSTGEGPFRVPDYADDVLAVIRSRGADRVHIGGVSLGGLIGCLLAQERPDLVQSVTAFGSALTGTHPDLDGGMKRLREVGIEAYFQKSMRRDAVPAVEQNLARLVALATIGRTNVDVVEAVTRTGFGEDLTGTIRPSGRPVHIITGEFDATCTPAGGSALAAAAGGWWTRIDDAGHVLPVEDPEGCAAAITAALAQED